MCLKSEPSSEKLNSKAIMPHCNNVKPPKQTKTRKQKINAQSLGIELLDNRLFMRREMQSEALLPDQAMDTRTREVKTMQNRD